MQRRAHQAAAMAMVLATVGCQSDGSAEKRPEPAGPPQTQQAQDAANSYLERLLADDPGFARGAGLHQADGQPMAVGEDAVAAQVNAARAYLAQTDALDMARVQDPARLDVELTRLRAQQVLFAYVDRKVHHRVLGYADLFDVSGYLEREYAPAAQRADAVVRHLEAATARADAMLALLTPAQPRPHLVTAQIIMGGHISYLQEDAPAAMADVLNADPAQRARFEEARTQAVHALQRILTWIEHALPRANDDFRLGEQQLLKLLAVNEGLTKSLTDLRAMAQQDYDRNHTALVQLAASMEPGVPVEEVVAHVANKRLPAAQVLAVAETQLTTLRAFLVEKDIISLPGDDQARVMVTPPFLRYNSAFLSSPGPLETQGRVSFYYITPPDPAWSSEKQAAYLPFEGDLAATSIHEVYPGHFVHSLHQRHAPTRAQQLLGSYAFTEGWAHYAEQMVLDQGYGADDPGMRVGQLTNALLRNCRFLATLGLHVDGMSVDAAQRLFQEKCLVDEGNAQQQALRGTYDPGYFSYTLGKLQILALRHRYMEAHPDASLRAFHDWLLGFGAAPVALIEKRL